MNRPTRYNRTDKGSACFSKVISVSILLALFQCHTPFSAHAFIAGQGWNLRTLKDVRLPMAYLNDPEIGITHTHTQEGGSSPHRMKSLESAVDGVSELRNTATMTKTDYPGAGTLGDIMSTEDDRDDEKTGLSKAGLVTLEGGTLAARFGVRSPLDRMALTANGNLQRIFSSYYDAPVHVVVDKCEQVSGELWDRVVHLTVHNQTFCTAKASVIVHDKACQDLVRNGKVGLGQLFRHLDRLPTFELMDAGYSEETGGLWRLYELCCAEVSCRIHENFHPNAWSFGSNARDNM